MSSLTLPLDDAPTRALVLIAGGNEWWAASKEPLCPNRRAGRSRR
ncbi:hypothetical protein [Streptomyces sp. CC224B]|nr:hypothetical protein [Streptomyces sp. CC224B]